MRRSEGHENRPVGCQDTPRPGSRGRTPFKTSGQRSLTSFPSRPFAALASLVIANASILTPEATLRLGAKRGAQVEKAPDPGESKSEPSSSESTEKSSSNSVHHISRKMLVAGGSIFSAIAVAAGTPLVIKAVDHYFFTPDQQVTTPSPAPPPQGTETANSNPCLPSEVWDPGRSLCHPTSPGQAVTGNPCFAYEYWDPPTGLCHPGPFGPSPANSRDNPCYEFEWYDVAANECVFVPEDQRPA
jgi:hypothetical protein